MFTALRVHPSTSKNKVIIILGNRGSCSNFYKPEGQYFFCIFQTFWKNLYYSLFLISCRWSPTFFSSLSASKFVTILITFHSTIFIRITNSHSASQNKARTATSYHTTRSKTCGNCSGKGRPHRNADVREMWGCGGFSGGIQPWEDTSILVDQYRLRHYNTKTNFCHTLINCWFSVRF